MSPDPDSLDRSATGAPDAARPRVVAPRPFLGAYALAAGLGPEAESATFDGCSGLPIAGLELPLAAADAASPWFSRHVRPGWDLVVTCIPTVMQRLGEDAGYGLASTDAEGRRAAIHDVAAAAGFARRLADDAGRVRVHAIQVHTAPGPTRGSLAALSRSLDELATWDVAGARIAVEHCDAARPGRPVHKGFFGLDDELAVLADRDRSRFGLTVNWGRSAIDGRSADTPVQHVAAAADAGVLAGIVFSGATDVVTEWGAPWDDTHIPSTGDDPALARSAPSLLGPVQLRDVIRSARGTPDYLAVKVTVRPQDAAPAERVAVAAAVLRQVEEARARVAR